MARKSRNTIKAECHSVFPPGYRSTAGHEFPHHIEHQLPKEQIEADLVQILGSPRKRSTANKREETTGQPHDKKYSRAEADEGQAAESEAPLDAITED